MVICVKLYSSFDMELTVYYVTQGINIKTMCPYYILEFRNTTLH